MVYHEAYALQFAALPCTIGCRKDLHLSNQFYRQLLLIMVLPYTGYLVKTIHIYDIARVRRLVVRIIYRQSTIITILYIVALSRPYNDGENPYLVLLYPLVIFTPSTVIQQIPS